LNLKENKLDILITIAVLVWLETFSKENYNSWQMIFKKAIDWLDMQGIKYNEYSNIGKQILKIN